MNEFVRAVFRSLVLDAVEDFLVFRRDLHEISIAHFSVQTLVRVLPREPVAWLRAHRVRGRVALQEIVRKRMRIMVEWNKVRWLLR